MPKMVFYDMPTRENGPLFSPNTVVIRLALLHKQIPFTNVELTGQQLKSPGPGSFSERLKGQKTCVPMVEIPLDSNGNVETPDENGDCRGQGLLIQDTLAIAALLDQFYPETPSLFLPENEKVDPGSREWRVAYNYALMTKQGLGTSMSRWAKHYELGAESAARNMEGLLFQGFTSDSKAGLKNAWAKLCEMDKARSMGETRRSLLPIVSLLSTPEPIISCSTTMPLERVPETYQPQYLSSPSKPGIVDYLVFGRFIFSYSCDLELNDAIWSFDSSKAREWLKKYGEGQWEVKEEIGEWDGDVELPNVKDWTERLLDMYGSHVRSQMDRERR